MSPPAFTKGPWDWWDDGKTVRVTEAAEQHQICEVTLPSDARLIAAAPTMFAKLENWVFLVETGQIGGIGVNAFATETRELLAKATGAAQ